MSALGRLRTVGVAARYLPSWLGNVGRRFGERCRAAGASFAFRPGELLDQQFLRYVHYRRLETWLRGRFGEGDGVRAVEFGGSNGVVSRMLPAWRYEIAPNYPEVDVHDLSAYASAAFDLVVLDQVLEHLADPQRAVAEVRRVLRPGGECVATTPFLIEVHAYPDDFWRYTASGLARLFRDFSNVAIDGWGNRLTVKTIARHGWLSCRNTRRLLAVATWNEPAWPVNFLTIATK